MTWKDVSSNFDNDYPFSPSALKTYMRCPKQFEFSYIKGIKKKPNFKMVFGSSIHKGVEVNYKHKFLKKKDLKVEDVQQAFSEDIKKRVVEEDVDMTDQDLGRTIDEGVLILSKYQKDVAPNVQPILEPEIELIGTVPGVTRKLRGFIDLVANVRLFGMNIKSVLRDTKTTARMYTQEQTDTDVQLTVYAYLLNKIKQIAVKKVQFDVIVRKKNPEYNTISSDRKPEHFKRMEEQIRGIEKGIQAGIFYPVDNHQTCAWCGYANMCHTGRAWSTPK